MPSSSAVRAGRAFVEISGDDRKLERTLRQVERKLKSVGSVLVRVGAIATAAGLAFAPLGIAAVRAASDAEESLSRFAAVFGSQTDAAASFAEDLARRIGRSSVEVKDSLATYQSFFVGLGFGAQEALELSKQMGELALDFASFNNLTDDDAIGRFISALSGSSEVLDRFGINTKQAALQQELLRIGINKAWSEVTEQEKAIARLNIIMRTMGDQGAVGDATRTAGSFANQMKRLRANVRDITIEVGRALIPVLKPVVAVATSVLGVVKQLIQSNPALTAGIFITAAGVAVLGALLLGLGLAATVASIAIGGLATIASAAGAVLAVITSPITLTIAAVVALGAAIIYYTGIGGRAIDWLRERFVALADAAAPVVKAIAESFRAGNIEGAVQILWAGILVAWEKGKQSVIQATVELGVGIVVILTEQLNKAKNLFDQAASFITITWLKVLDTITGSNLADAIAPVLDAGVNARATQRANELEALEDALGSLLLISDDAGNSAVDRARENLARVIEEARQANEDLKATASGSTPGIDFSGIAAASRRAFSSSGAFSAVGGRAFSASSPAERTANAAEKIQESTQRIEQEVKQTQGAVFT